MSSFLTVEDVNTALISHYNTPFWSKVVIDCSSIGVDFDGLMFDYLTVDRELDDSDYVYTISVDNSFWSKKYVIFDDDGNRIDDVTVSGGKLVVTTDSSILTCYFYIMVNDLEEESSPVNVPYFLTDFSPLKCFSGFSNPFTISFNVELFDTNYELDDLEFTVGFGSRTVTAVPDEEGMVEIVTYLSNTDGTDLSFTVTDNLYSVTWKFYCNCIRGNLFFYPVTGLNGVVGEFSTLSFACTQGLTGVDADDFLVNSRYPVTSVDIVGKELQVTLDLRGLNTNSNVGVNIIFQGDEKFLPNQFHFRVPTKYNYINSLDDLISGLNGGLDNIRLGSDLSFSDYTGSLTVPVTHDCSLIGGTHSLELVEDIVFLVKEGVNFKVDGTVFNNVSSFILQEQDSTVELRDCTFNPDSSNGSEVIGKIIQCDTDVEDLSVDDDFTTIIRDCTFNSVGNCFLHGGRLTVSGSVFNLTDVDCLNTRYPWVVYQTDGECSFTGNIFNSEFTTDVPITFGACLFTVGTRARINGVTYSNWRDKNNSKQLCESRNASTVDMSYPYDGDTIHVENSSRCGYLYAVSGGSTVFKVDVNAIREA